MNQKEKPKTFLEKALGIIKPIKSTISPKKLIKRRTYERITNEQCQVLIDFYEENKYPSLKETKNLGRMLKKPPKKIENWFKHKRRQDANKGKMKFERKKVFSQSEKEAMMKEFLANPLPSDDKFKEMSKSFQCEVRNIKNWFSYKRKILIKLKRVHGDQFLPNSVLKLEEQVKNESIQLKTEANIQENMKTELIENSEVGQTKESFDEISNQRTMQKYLIYNSIAFQMQEEMKLKVALTNLAMMKSLGYMN